MLLRYYGVHAGTFSLIVIIIALPNSTGLLKNHSVAVVEGSLFE